MSGRAIKFRVWNRAINTYLSKTQLPWLKHDGTLWSKSCCHCGFDEELCETDLTIEQFTGLLDKDGCEIYEGDIVQFDNYYKELSPSIATPLVCRIGWDVKSARFVVLDGDTICADWVILDRTKHVLGNIHQNTELLKPTS